MNVFKSKSVTCFTAAVVAYFANAPIVKANLVLEQQKVAPAAAESAETVSAVEETAPAVVSAPAVKKAPLVIEQKTTPTVIVQDDNQIIAPVTGTVIPVGEPKPSGTAAILQKMEDNNRNALKLMEMKRIEQEDRFGKSVEGAISGVGAAPAASPAPQADTLTAPAAAPAQQPAPQPSVVVVPVKDEFVGSMKSREKEELEVEDDELEYERDSEESSRGRSSKSSARLKDLVDEEQSMKSEKTMITVRGGGGMPGMSVDESYSVNGRYAAGFAIGADIGDHLGVEAAYTYSVYGIALSPANSYVGMYGYNTSYENYALKQNVFDVTMKVYLTGRDSTLRPFIGGGLGYSKGFINYDQQQINYFRSMGVPTESDYEIASYLGVVGGGLDVNVTKNLTIGAGFKYYTVFSSNENQPLNNAALSFGPNYGYQYNPTNFQKQYLGGSLAQSGFYTVLLNAALSF